MRKLTYKHVKKVFEDGGCELLSDVYIGARVPLSYRCSCGNKSVISLNNFQKGQRCQKCSDKNYLTRLKIDYIRDFFQKNSCVLLSEIYKNNKTKLDYICVCGRKAQITFNAFRDGGRCKKCGIKKASETKTFLFKDVKRYFEERGCQLLETLYLGIDIPMDYICKCGKKSKISFWHFKDGSRCRECAVKKLSGKNSVHWNHNLTEEEREIRRCYPEYGKWRTKVYKKNNFICQKCDKRGGKLVAHHILNYSTYKGLRLVVSNGVTLCNNCHTKFHKKYGKRNNNQKQLDLFYKKDFICE